MMSIRIRYSCPHCGRRIIHHAALAGHLVICSACKGEFYEPTDPLPGKPAERALEALPDAPRRLRVPEGNNPRHDLAILSRRDGSDVRTITEIVEAVLLDREPPLPTPDDLPVPAREETAPAEPAGVESMPSETISDFGYVQMKKEQEAHSAPAIPSWQPPSKQRLFKPSPLIRPAAPASETPAPSPSTPAHASPSTPAGVKPGDSDHALDYAPAPLPPVPALAGPAMRSLVSQQASGASPVVAAPQSQRSVPKPSVPGSTGGSGKPAASPLSGVSIKQMVEELRRRGLGVAMITCDIAPMRNYELAFSDNMTRDDALAVVRKYLDSLREPQPKGGGRSGLQKRVWRTGEDVAE